MKKYIFLIGMVALMSSCNDDIYDNIKEFVNSETVYPAGYDQTQVSLLSGYERVEIYLMGDNREEKPYLAKAIKTVVKWGEGANDSVSFTPARSWVNVTGLTVAQVYHFQIYTEDEFGNTSTPVSISGKPFNKADEGLLVIADVIASANISQAVITPTLAPESYEITGGTYSFTSGDTVTFTGPRIVLQNLSAGETYNVHTTFDLLPAGALDTIPITYDVEVKTMTQGELDAYINSTSPFPATSDGRIGNPYYVTSAAPFVFSGAAFDLGGEGKGFHGKPSWNAGDPNYRKNGGDEALYHGVDLGAPDNLTGIAWTTVGNWYAYTVYVQDPGEYKVEYIAAQGLDGGQATLTLDALDILGIIPIANSGWQYQWSDPNVSVRLSAGTHKFRWTLLGVYFNFGGLRLTFVSP